MKLSPTEIFKGKKIFFIGGTGFVPEMLGWEHADNLTEAIAMGRSYRGRNAEITMPSSRWSGCVM